MYHVTQRYLIIYFFHFTKIGDKYCEVRKAMFGMFVVIFEKNLLMEDLDFLVFFFVSFEEIQTSIFGRA